MAVHAGWRGLADGVIDVAVDELAKRDDHSVAAVLGPCIHAECYEFGVVDLAAVAGGVGADVDRIARSTADGRTRLDVPAAVAAALARRGIGLDVVGPCTVVRRALVLAPGPAGRRPPCRGRLDDRDDGTTAG